MKKQDDQDADVVGIEDPRREIFELLDLEGKDSRCSVISVVGMGGIGKTTLARKVYYNVEVKRYFYVCAWVNVTQTYCREDVFRGMLQEFYKTSAQPAPAEIQQMDEMSLIGEVMSFLEDKRYMVVFDDVWDVELWNHVGNALPDNGKGSKILLTTRQETVALTWKRSSTTNNVYKLKLLPPDKAWELFCNKAFQGDYNGQCPEHLEAISHNIVDKCQGLPLALVTIGGLLSTKQKLLTEWKEFHNRLGSELSNISGILLLSYNDLPHSLKPCLLYFGMFPEGSSIEHNRLIKLWTAEDLIKDENDIAIEDVVEEYLLELIKRNLVQVSIRYDDGRIRALRVHDLLHATLCQKLGELNTQSKRLSIQEGSLDDASRSINSGSSICSILWFRAQEATNVLIMPSSLLKKVYLLKVLDLQGAPIKEIPEEVGDLFFLQYLSLRFTQVKSIPKPIGKLENLLTLDLKRCPIWELPVEIGNLRKLQHLVVYQNTWHNTLKVWVIGAVKIPGGALGRLESLQKLADVNIANSVGCIDQLSNFKKLKYIAISNVKRENSWTLCKAIEKLTFLQSLNISVDYDSNDPLDLDDINSPPLQLHRLYLIGPLKEFPAWIGKLENLNKLRFRGSKLDDIPFDILQDLPNLTMLGINKDVYYGERLVFQAGGFKKLKAMYFDSLLNLSSVEIQPGALPLLEDLLIHRSPQLKEVPLGLQYLEKLTSLKLVEMPEEFVDSIGSFPSIVKHVADIRVGYQTPTGQYIYKKL